ncbi:MAG: serine/threonine-protein kinase [Myxococcota bacterium]
MSRPQRSSPLADASLASSPSEEETLLGTVARSIPVRSHGRGDRVGRYFLLDVVGEGAMGRVYRAYDPDLDRRIAIKLLFAAPARATDEPERLLHEAQAMARIDHPNVVTVHDVGVHEGSVFIAMELVDGPALDRWLETRPPKRRILDVMLEAARGMAAAHAAGVIHRDFKPGNVLVTSNGHAKVGDFGLAGLEDAAPTREDPATYNHALGTPAYMSPEHVRGTGIDARSDQFSFAIALYEALYGERPFSARSWPELASTIVCGELDPSAHNRRGSINRVIRRALSVDPAQRFESMEALIARLERIRHPRWPRWLAVGGLGLALALAFRGGSSDPLACDPGKQLVNATWNMKTQAAIQLGGSEFTEVFAREARARFERAVSDYSARWAEAYDASCAAVGPRTTEGTAAEQVVAQCLDNRLDSLRGLVEFATAQPLDAGRLDELSTLPSIEDCTTGRWVPYPSEPDRAARAARLHRSIGRIRMARLAERDDGTLERGRATVQEARALGDPYLLARALREQARVLDRQGEPQAAMDMLDEALQVALAAGHDLLAAKVINAMLMTAKRLGAKPAEIARLGPMARGLIERAGGDHILAGNIALNEGNILRMAGRFEETMARDEEAAMHFAAAGDEESQAKARLNQAVTGLSQGHFEQMERPLLEATAAIERTSGESSPTAFFARMLVIRVTRIRGQVRRALSLAKEVFDEAREFYAPGSHTLRDSTMLYAASALEAGELDIAERMLNLVQTYPGESDEEKADVARLLMLMLQAQERHAEVLERIPASRNQVASGNLSQRALVELGRVNSLYLVGRVQEVEDALGDPVIVEFLTAGTNEGFVVNTALLGVLAGATHPKRIPWRDSFDRNKAMIWSTTRLLDVIEAIETDTNARLVALRVRAELIAQYSQSDIHAQLLDAWLGTSDPA